MSRRRESPTLREVLLAGLARQKSERKPFLYPLPLELKELVFSKILDNRSNAAEICTDVQSWCRTNGVQCDDDDMFQSACGALGVSEAVRVRLFADGAFDRHRRFARSVELKFQDEVRNLLGEYKEGKLWRRCFETLCKMITAEEKKTIASMWIEAANTTVAPVGSEEGSATSLKSRWLHCYNEAMNGNTLPKSPARNRFRVNCIATICVFAFEDTTKATFDNEFRAFEDKTNNIASLVFEQCTSPPLQDWPVFIPIFNAEIQRIDLRVNDLVYDPRFYQDADGVPTEAPPFTQHHRLSHVVIEASRLGGRYATEPHALLKWLLDQDDYDPSRLYPYTGWTALFTTAQTVKVDGPASFLEQLKAPNAPILFVNNTDENEEEEQSEEEEEEQSEEEQEEELARPSGNTFHMLVSFGFYEMRFVSKGFQRDMVAWEHIALCCGALRGKAGPSAREMLTLKNEYGKNALELFKLQWSWWKESYSAEVELLQKYKQRLLLIHQVCVHHLSPLD